jgi:hypothetical protein
MLESEPPVGGACVMLNSMMNRLPVSIVARDVPKIVSPKPLGSPNEPSVLFQ